MNHDNLDLESLSIPYMETTKVGDYVIKIEKEIDSESPRDWEPIGTIVCWDNYNSYGDEHEYDSPRAFIHEVFGLFTNIDTDELTNEQFVQCETVANANNIILPVFKYEHSDVTISTTPRSCKFDSGQIGYIFVSKEYSVEPISHKRHKEINNILENEITVYNQYINGDMYWYSVDKVEGDEETYIDSCGGFYGYDDTYMIECIKDVIRYDIMATSQQTEMF